MNAIGPAGFWSYTHRDDHLDGGRIRRLAEAIAHAFEITTGDELHVFVDNNSIAWGEQWRARLDSALTSTTFLIPIVTPKFLKSQECRREIITFSSHAASLGLDDLILPIHYVNVPQLTEGDSSDEVVQLIARRQWVDWRQLRLEDEHSPEYRQAVNDLALRLKGILETPPASGPIVIPSNDTEVDQPGFLDSLAEMEVSLPEWAETVQEFGEVLESLNQKTLNSAALMQQSDDRGGGFAGRLRVTNELAADLGEPVAKMSELGGRYSAELSRIDPGIITIIRMISEGEVTQEEEETAREFFTQLMGMIVAAREAVPNLQSVSDGARVMASGSRALRPLMNSIQTAAQQVIDGQTLIEEWGRMIDELGQPVAEAGEAHEGPPIG
ncbi:toll/interleukin-1 receptor domain-containing protein [Streptomyces sp. ISL-98]|uniref:toll/interleukin-1 receptor domain-containing protein n=1 Tax=Streptomyces sp. ISL-98 TaxID=2819192 RepID=UPI001BEBBD50|nr:toll/interleukin-1 receptor domain-containing protein [Streptomyces sp. ISL-98]MBT2510022.1 toll/interleukin-1 receptor domain-containing protein [Streptomyces sp. ISL-98]